MTDLSGAAKSAASTDNALQDKTMDAPVAKNESSSRRDILLGTAVAATAAAAAGAASAQERTRVPIVRPVVAEPEPWGEPVALSRMPVVFNFRPDRMVRVAPARLREWEQLFAANIGIRPGSETGLGQGETISGSGGTTGGWDDCDYVA
jgi:hypothetical protein